MNSVREGADVIVVGAGIIGLLSAWELTRAGRSVIVLDKGEPGHEASWAAAGILAPLGPWRYPEQIQQLVLESQRLYPSLCEELHSASGINPEYQRSGMLILLDTPELKSAQEWVSTSQSEHAFLTAEQLEKDYPQLNVVPPALWLPQAAQLRNPRLLQALQTALHAQGITVQANTPVQRLLVEDGRVQGVETPAGMLSADAVLLAAGAWTQELIPRDAWRPDIRPVKGQMLLYRAQPGLLDCMVLQGARYLVPRRDGLILAGSSMEEEGFNKSPTVEIKQQLREFAENMLPALADCEVQAHWTGLRPASPDGLPVVGPHPDLRGLWLNCGHFRNGIALAPATVRRLAEMLLRANV